MADFILLDKLLVGEETIPTSSCVHETKKIEKSVLICMDCGEEIEKDIFLDSKLYPEIQIKQDVSRCHIRKMEEKNIYKDVEDMGFGERIVSIANEIYIEATKGKIYRGNSRKSIVFCLYF